MLDIEIIQIKEYTCITMETIGAPVFMSVNTD